MKIAGLYIRNYYNIKNQFIDLDDEYNFTLDEQRSNSEILITIEAKEFSPSFFPKGLTVTAIAGENGTGKTTLLNSLFMLSTSDLRIECIVIFREGMNLYIHKNLDVNVTIDTEVSFIVFSEKEKAYSDLDFSTIIFTNVATVTTEHVSDRSALISERYLIKCGIEDDPCFDQSHVEPYEAHELNDIKRQISYISTRPKNLDISLPDNLEIGMSKAYFSFLQRDKKKPKYLGGLFEGKEILINNEEHEILLAVTFSVFQDTYKVYTLGEIKKLHTKEFLSHFKEIERNNSVRDLYRLLIPLTDVKFFMELVGECPDEFAYDFCKALTENLDLRIL